MKRCTKCGKDYPDEATACAIDGQPLAAISPTPPPSQGESAAVRPGSPIVRAAIVSGVIFLLGVLRIAAFARGQSDPPIFKMLAIVLMACVVAIGVVAFWSRRTRTPWPWGRVIVVTFLSCVGFGIFCLALGVAVAFFSKGPHQ